MAFSAQLSWLLVLTGSALLAGRMVRGWAVRSDPTLTVLAGGLVGLAFVSLAMLHAPVGW